MDGRRDWIADVGLAVVGAAAAVLTFTTLRDLAEDCGITGTFLGVPLSWLVPVTVDAAGIVAARVWLKRRAGTEAVRFARVLAWACIAASVAGNAGQHGMAAYGLRPGWWVVVLVSAIPPATLGAVVHLAHLVGRADQVVRVTVTESVMPRDGERDATVPRDDCLRDGHAEDGVMRDEAVTEVRDDQRDDQPESVPAGESAEDRRKRLARERARRYRQQQAPSRALHDVAAGA